MLLSYGEFRGPRSRHFISEYYTLALISCVEFMLILKLFVVLLSRMICLEKGSASVKVFDREGR